MDILNDMFRIVETYAKYGNIFHIEERVTTKNTWFHKILGFTPSFKWRRLRYVHYCHIVNRVNGYEYASYTYGSHSAALRFLEIYIEYLKAKPFKYKGRKFKPMFYYNHHDHSHSLRYYDVKSYKTYGEHDRGYRTIGTEKQLKYEVDEKEAEGKLVGIHKVV